MTDLAVVQLQLPPDLHSIWLSPRVGRKPHRKKLHAGSNMRRAEAVKCPVQDYELMAQRSAGLVPDGRRWDCMHVSTRHGRMLRAPCNTTILLIVYQPGIEAPHPLVCFRVRN